MRPDAIKVTVVGGGPAGIAAALRARRLGADVVLLESHLLGGVCYNEGPVPVRTLARAARMARDARAWAEFGLVGKPAGCGRARCHGESAKGRALPARC